MILLDGKKLAEELKDKLKKEFQKLRAPATLVFVEVGENPVSRKFIEQKKKLGEELGVSVRVRNFPDGISGSELRKKLAEIVHDDAVSGVVIQLPLPNSLLPQTQDILNAVVPKKDIDVLSARSVGDYRVGKSRIAPPVVGAIQALFEKYGIEYKKSHIVIIGAGQLVGKPIADWLLREQIPHTVLTDKSLDISSSTKNADILISGTGRAGLITGDMIQEGAVIIDAGTSEMEGRLVGDTDFPSVSEKAGFITPVPGGVGPLTVVMIYKNLLELLKNQ
ncbi:MAG: bifunctional 5,10-methylenetetrahydrofolate dehydrogenase/5,10-methenyltetrahydrofolate cyclohydrolase [Patescibacteria group bacterium]